MNKKAWMVSIGLFIAVIPLLFVFYILFFEVSHLPFIINLLPSKTTAGVIYDCDTNEPISLATISMVYSGWGFRKGVLVWDNSNITSTQSKQNGMYEIAYKIPDGGITVTRDGYLTAEEYNISTQSVNIGLKKNTGYPLNERTYGCRLSSECMVTKVIDGVEVSWNDCTSPEIGERYSK